MPRVLGRLRTANSINYGSRSQQQQICLFSHISDFSSRPKTAPRIIDDQSHTTAFNQIRQHLANSSTLTNFTICDALRSSYPNHSLTQVDVGAGLRQYSSASSLEFTAHLDTSIEYYASRERKADKDVVADSDVFNFDIELGRLNAKFQGQDIYVYVVQYYNNDSNCVRSHYILCPREYAKEENGVSSFVDELITAAQCYMTEAEDEIWLYDDGYWSRSKKLYSSIEKCTWDHVILNQALKQALQKDVLSFFDQEEHYKSYGVPWKRGLILHGLPGNGKTITIKAIMKSIYQRQTPIPTLYVKSLGLSCSPSHIRSIFEKARATAPCLLVLEDLDSLVTEHVRSVFLNEVDGLEQNQGILMIGSTNHLDRLDVGISKRPSRFDRKYHFSLPALQERIQYCDFWRAKITTSSGLEFPADLSSKIAEATEGLSFAYLQEAFISCMKSLADEAGSAGEQNPMVKSMTEPAPSNPNPIWRNMHAQIEKIRQEIQDSRKSVEDAGKSSVLADATSNTARRTGFGK